MLHAEGCEYSLVLHGGTSETDPVNRRDMLLAAFVAVGVLLLPLPYVLLVLFPLSVALMWRRPQ